MAKETTANKKNKSFEETLWDSANKLRGSMEPSEYKHVVQSLIFLKFASDKFEERRNELIKDSQGEYAENVAFYTMKNVFYLPVESRWSYIKANAKQDDLAIKVDTTRQLSAEMAVRRNEWVATYAARIVIAHASPSGSLQQQAQQWKSDGRIVDYLS